MQTAFDHPQLTRTIPFRTKKRIILPLILISTLLLRLYLINQPYIDLAGWRETSMAMMADNFHYRNPNILFPEVSWNGPGESYNGREFQTVTYSAHLLYYVFGQHDWMGRLVNIFFGVWGVFALYQLVRRVWDEPHALVSAAVLALLPSAIYFDRSFLPDPAMVSLVTTSFWFLIAYLQTDQRRYLLLTMLAACWGFLTKITGMLVLLPMLYAVLSILYARKKLTFSAFAKLIIPTFFVIAVVAAYYLWARYLSVQYPPYHFAGEDNWLWDEGLKKWLEQGYFLEKAIYIYQNWMLGNPFLALFLAGLVFSFFYIKGQKTKLISAPYLFHFWLLGCLVFYCIGAKELIGNFWNFHIGDPMIAAFCSSTILFVGRILKRQRTLAWLLGFLLLAYIAKSDRRVLRNTFADKYYRTDYQMGLRLQQIKQPGDLVIVLSHDVGNPIPIFYSRSRGWVFPPAGEEAWDKLPPNDAACIAIIQNLQQQGAAWFAVNGEQYQNFQTAYPQFAQYLTSHFPLRVQEPDFVIFQIKR